MVNVEFVFFVDYMDPDFITDQQRFSDMTFLQTTIYTVIGKWFNTFLCGIILF